MKTLIFYIFYAYAMKIYHKDKDYEKAKKYYKIAEKFLPTHAKNHFKIGMCYYKLKDYYNANESFEKALKFNPNNEQWKNQLESSKSFTISIFYLKSFGGKKL